jgi:hypothetical protein
VKSSTEALGPPTEVGIGGTVIVNVWPLAELPVMVALAMTCSVIG